MRIRHEKERGGTRGTAPLFLIRTQRYSRTQRTDAPSERFIEGSMMYELSTRKPLTCVAVDELLPSTGVEEK